MKMILMITHVFSNSVLDLGTSTSDPSRNFPERCAKQQGVLQRIFQLRGFVWRILGGANTIDWVYDIRQMLSRAGEFF